MRVLIAIAFFLGLVYVLFVEDEEAIALGSATLTWTPPTLNEDGSPLTDLAGYTISRGVTASGPYTQQYDVPDPAATSLFVPDLADDTTHYFIAQAYDDNGNTSVPSNEVSLLVGDTTAPNPPVLSIN